MGPKTERSEVKGKGLGQPHPHTAVGWEGGVNILVKAGGRGGGSRQRTPCLSQAPYSHPSGVACDKGLGLS